MAPAGRAGRRTASFRCGGLSCGCCLNQACFTKYLAKCRRCGRNGLVERHGPELGIEGLNFHLSNELMTHDASAWSLPGLPPC